MRIINICRDDYANFAYHNAQALKSIGLNADSFKLQPHAFGYPAQSMVVPPDVMKEQLRSADVVQLFHNDKELFNWCLNIQALPGHSHLRIVPYHSCSLYRDNPAWYQQHWHPHVHMVLSNQCEFFMPGAQGSQPALRSTSQPPMHYITTAIDLPYYDAISSQAGDNSQTIETTETLQTLPSPINPAPSTLIAHHPSNFTVKGTGKIVEMMQQIKAPHQFVYSTDKMPYQQQLQRVTACDIYVELFAPTLNGQPYGCYGVAAFEAAAMGKVVVTNNIYPTVYDDAYGECLLQIANTEDEFIATINRLLSMPKDELHALGQRTRQWVMEKHSYEATGNRLCNLLGLLIAVYPKKS